MKRIFRFFLNRRYVFAIIFLAVAIMSGFIHIESRPETFDQLIRKIGYNSKKYIQIYSELNKKWKIPDGYELENIKIGNMDAYWLYASGSKSDHVIIQLHGGAYRKSLKDKRIVCQRYAVKMAQISNSRILTIDYRVAPANPYPAALEDSVSAYQWLLDNGYKAKNIIITGDSAGGGLALATGLYLRDHNTPMPAAIITMSAWTNLNYPQLVIPYVGDNDACNPYISPFYGNYHDFPPMLMQVGGAEYILNNTTIVASKAKKDGANVTLGVYAGMRHVFQMMYPAIDSSNQAWDEIETFIHGIYSNTNE